MRWSPMQPGGPPEFRHLMFEWLCVVETVSTHVSSNHVANMGKGKKKSDAAIHMYFVLVCTDNTGLYDLTKFDHTLI